MINPVSHCIEFCATLATRMRGTSYLAALYTEMHGRAAFPGQSWRTHVDTLIRCIPDIGSRIILDYGCGPLGGLAGCFGDKVISYDPFVEKYAVPPWGQKVDVIFSSDVLEHMKLSAIDEFLVNVRQATPQFVFLNISTRPAHKRLPNGANAHLTVKPAAWWLRYLRRSLRPLYEPVLAEDDLLRNEGTFFFQTIAGK